MTQLTAPGLSLKQFSAWGPAEAYYNREFNKGRVVLVKPGTLLSPPKIIATSANILKSGETLTGTGTKDDPVSIASPQKRVKITSYYPVAKSRSSATTRVVRNPAPGCLTFVREASDGDIYRINQASGSGSGSAGDPQPMGAHATLMACKWFSLAFPRCYTLFNFTVLAAMDSVNNGDVNAASNVADVIGERLAVSEGMAGGEMSNVEAEEE